MPCGDRGGGEDASFGISDRRAVPRQYGGMEWDSRGDGRIGA